jgi:glucan biosynthesis protein C
VKIADGSPPPERLHALDAVRAYALLLGIVFHATCSFIPAPASFWIVKDSQPSITLSVLAFVIHVWRMTTFFLIAGFFAHMSFHRRGARDFIKDRLKRIALPLLVGSPISFAITVVLTYWADGFPPDWPVPSFSLTHLWFLYVLLVFYAAVLVLRGIVIWLDQTGRIRAVVDNLVGLLMCSWLAPATLAVPIVIAFMLDPTWTGWIGVGPGKWVLGLQGVASFGAAFGFGWLLHRQMDLIRILERRWLFNFVIAIGLITASVFLASPPMPMDNDAIRLADSVCYALAIWTTTFAVIGRSLRYLSDFSPARRYIADASYWLYLIHLPIVMALQIALAPLDWPWAAKFATILVVALPIMFVSYQRLVRYSVIGAVLTGPRTRPP